MVIDERSQFRAHRHTIDDLVEFAEDITSDSNIKYSGLFWSLKKKHDKPSITGNF